MDRHTIAFHPTRGPNGSIYQTFDGKTYVRTPFGTRVVDSTVGPSLFYAYRLRHRTLVLGMLCSLVVGVVLGALTL